MFHDPDGAGTPRDPGPPVPGPRMTGKRFVLFILLPLLAAKTLLFLWLKPW
jgi:hypothetical protein